MTPRDTTGRAATLLLYLAVVVPVTMLAAAFAIDAVRIMATNHEVSNAARAAARAATQQYVACDPELPATCARVDSRRARTTATDTIDAAAETFRAGVDVDRVAVDVRSSRLSGSVRPASEVSVTVDYTLTDLIFAPALISLTGGSDGGTDMRSFSATTTRSAYVCIPDEQTRNVGDSCSLPRLG